MSDSNSPLQPSHLPPPAPVSSAGDQQPALPYPAPQSYPPGSFTDAPSAVAQAYPGAAPSYSPPPAPPAHSSQPPYGVAPQPGYPMHGGQYMPASRPTSGLAITSLVCGIAGVALFWLFLPMLASIVAVITGHMALRQITANPNLGGRGMAIAGLIMGYVMAALLVISVALTLLSVVFFGAFTLPFIFSS